MSCCGQKRAAIPKPASSTPANRAALAPVVWFQYTGASALTVIGRVSNTPYRFSHRGAVLAADRRDMMSLAAFPSLQRINEPRK